MEKDSRIFVAGHGGLVGSAIVRRLQAEGFRRIIVRTRAECDLENQEAVNRLFLTERPQFVFMAAAKVGGILANKTYPGDFIRSNLAVQSNILEASLHSGVEKLVFLGSSCIYPRNAVQPIREESLLTGPLEPTNEAYAIAKIAGIKSCQAYHAQYGLNAISLMPTNLFGPFDNFNLMNGHVLPAMIRKFHDAVMEQKTEVVIWGSGTPRREFLHVDDFADACVHMMKIYNSPEIINVGSGEEISIYGLAQLVAEAVGFGGSIVADTSKPDGCPYKLLDVSKIHALGWHHKINLKDGIRWTYRWFQENQEIVRW